MHSFSNFHLSSVCFAACPMPRFHTHTAKEVVHNQGRQMEEKSRIIVTSSLCFNFLVSVICILHVHPVFRLSQYDRQDVTYTTSSHLTFSKGLPGQCRTLEMQKEVQRNRTHTRVLTFFRTT
mmetsp:Transcript_15677/g.39818  ORF Transcript_15677/g.39818 Transcript_15677/m.39818 type:complete len:122 (+) Transcript_15677:332-697(+)